MAAPRRTALLVGLVAVGVGSILGGPVGGLLASVYGGLATGAALRGRAARAAARDRRRRLDGLAALAADLRTGLPVPTALAAFESPGQNEGHAGGDGEPDRLVRLARAAVRLAEQTGAPLADLLERIEGDARATDRGLAVAAAQAAGTRATAWLLAVLPSGGVALGYVIGADPVQVLLHTPVGAGCALGAVVLQVAGLAWTARLSGGGQRVVS
ncbi:type II secretion system F family protein [Micromonospora zhanjiangensis]|uniref:Type II secretion system F family protein n=1 Tax=Micromonospora zhanjiangensis TaxID=1522057 RepID=A0ABV8KPA5_9ACTN